MDFNKYQYYGMQQQAQTENENKKKSDAMKVRIEEFAKINTIEEAKNLAKQILPVANDINRFSVGNAKVIIINTSDIFRISFDSPDEFISYDFAE